MMWLRNAPANASNTATVVGQPSESAILYARAPAFSDSTLSAYSSDGLSNGLLALALDKTGATGFFSFDALPIWSLYEGMRTLLV